jgi:U3 small nucleolar RNA-associated protein 22
VGSTVLVHKPPTGAEVTAIKVAQDLFMSSAFKLQVGLVFRSHVSCCPNVTSLSQIDALLPNVRPKDSRRSPLNKFLFSLHAFLSSLPSIEPQHPLVAAKALSEDSLASFSSEREKLVRWDETATSPKTIAVPYPLPVPTEDANWKVAFEKPANISIVGSWINNVAVRRTDEEPWVIDMAVEMPSARLSLA